jgi:omega-hydroxy-beta-dihydromenaquinone-9 sulfotransferase
MHVHPDQHSRQYSTTHRSSNGQRAKRRRWAPRLWAGCSLRTWWQLLCRHRFTVDWPYLYIVLIDTIASALNSALAGVEHVAYGKRIARATIAPDPLFVIGHWRSGTTLLHELLCLDVRHGSPTAYQCLAPHHFVLTERILPPLLRFLLPGRRPIDEMELAWGSVFEDEFALCLLGARSPYESIAFPNTSPMQPALLDPTALTPAESTAWRELLLQFLRKLSFSHAGRRLVFKSPPHTCRLRVLLEMFPRARFVHIVRNPYAVFPSTVHLWRTLHRAQGLQRPRSDGLEESVLSMFEYVHACIERDRSLLPAGQFHELRYEDLLRDPVGELQRLYRQLDLDEPQHLRTSVEAYFSARADYRTNRFQLSADERTAIRRRWGHVVSRYGYDTAADSMSAPSSAAITSLCGGARTSK